MWNTARFDVEPQCADARDRAEPFSTKVIAFAQVADSGIVRTLEEDRLKFYTKLQEKARAQLANSGIGFHSYLVEGHGVEAIVEFLRQQKADLLVLGLHQRDLHIARLWSTVYELAQDAPCSVLGVH